MKVLYVVAVYVNGRRVAGREFSDRDSAEVYAAGRVRLGNASELIDGEVTASIMSIG